MFIIQEKMSADLNVYSTFIQLNLAQASTAALTYAGGVRKKDTYHEIVRKTLSACCVKMQLFGDKGHTPGSKNCPLYSRESKAKSKGALLICEGTPDLLSQSVQEPDVDLAVISEPYRGKNNAV